MLPHWLVVDGVQLAIPENAPLERPHARKRPRKAAALPAVAGGPRAAATAEPAVRRADAEGVADDSIVRAPVKHVLSQARNQLLTIVCPAEWCAQVCCLTSCIPICLLGWVSWQAPQCPTSTQELQLYFDKVSDVLLNGSTAAAGAANGPVPTATAPSGSSPERLERAVLASLSSDPGRDCDPHFKRFRSRIT